MLFKFFDTSSVKEVAEKIGAELRKSFPPSTIADSLQHEEKRRRIAEHLRRHAQKAIASTKFNFYQKVRLGTELQDVFERAGYPPAIGKAIAYDIVSLIAWTA